MPIDFEKLKKLREETGAGVLDTKRALEKFDGDYEKAKKDLMEKGLAKAEKKADKEANQGLVHSYIHLGGKVGSMVVVNCETDFVAKTEDFQKLCHELALQICANDYKDVEELVQAEYIRDTSKKISDLIKEATVKLGEKIEVKDFVKLGI